ncbi:transcriptional regulator [Pleomorphomonas oryzae]|uniref:transcriptional regulator n=1 Tax=Pleomorphomonas oryzae TaxID=261934 RepID=UPI000565A2B6|nr:Cro/CI family transcriptional regulator [Pleomorphomonas oryzae]
MSKLKLTCRENRGLVSKIAKHCGVTQGAVSQWLMTRVPAERVRQVEEVTRVPSHEIRPDLYPPPAPSQAGAAPSASSSPDGTAADAGDIASAATPSTDEVMP